MFWKFKLSFRRIEEDSCFEEDSNSCPEVDSDDTGDGVHDEDMEVGISVPGEDRFDSGSAEDGMVAGGR